VGIGAALFFTGAYMIPEGIGKREEDEGEPSPESVLEAMCNETGTRAIEEADEAIGLNPQDAAAYSNRGNAYARSGEHERVIQDYDEAIRLDPRYAPVCQYRGQAYASSGQVERAIQDHDELIRLTPQDADAFIW
tara:strand:- start:72 stop:476 length:405 start_codon:yes stop_codon:yes gene_type:complete